MDQWELNNQVAFQSLEDRSLPRHTHYGAYHGYLDSWHDSRSQKVSGVGATVIDIEKIPMNQSQDNSSHNETATIPLEAPNLLNGHAHKVWHFFVSFPFLFSKSDELYCNCWMCFLNKYYFSYSLKNWKFITSSWKFKC